MRKIKNVVSGFLNKKFKICPICGERHNNQYMDYCSNKCASKAFSKIRANSDKFNDDTSEYLRAILGIVKTSQSAQCSECGSHTYFLHTGTLKFLCSMNCIKQAKSDAKEIVTDPYLKSSTNISRLISEYYKYGKLIVAFDYDSTVYDYHNTGHTYDKMKELIRKAYNIGCYVIVYTCSGEERYPDIITYLKENNIPYHSINENCPDIDFAQNKLYYNILLDDRAGLASAYADLELAIDAIIHIEKKKRLRT